MPGRPPRAVLALLVVAFSACTETAPPPVTAKHPELSTTSSSPSEFEPRSAELVMVEEVRELRWQGPVDVDSMPRASLLEEASRQMRAEVPAEIIEAREMVLWLLGAVPRDFDFYASVEAALAETLVGLYDPRERRVMVAADAKPGEAALVRYHELGHALIDQHFDLTTLLDHFPDGADRLQARSSLAEGDASSLMFDALALAGGVPRDALTSTFLREMQTDMAGSTPRFVARLLSAPYVDGLLFVDTLRARGGWAEVNKVWRRLPESSEQVLHLDKYLAEEKPLAVDVPEPPASGCTLAYTEVLGEQVLRTLFEEWLVRDAARDAARGWNGDRLALYRCGEMPWLVLDVAADDDLSRERAQAAFSRGIAQLTCDSGRSVAARLDLTALGLRWAATDAKACEADGGRFPTCSSCQQVERTP